MTELHQGYPSDCNDGFHSDIERLYDHAYCCAYNYMGETLEYYRHASVEDVTPSDFWAEYIWCVYASGFNAKVLSQKFNGLMSAYGPWDWVQSVAVLWPRVKKVIANEKKFTAVLECRAILKKIGWDAFKEAFCTTPEALGVLPFIGKITKYHLARNIGMDCVKPDLHLVRLAKHYEFPSPEAMCEFLAGLSGERIGVVDLILWSYCAAFGTKELEA